MAIDILRDNAIKAMPENVAHARGSRLNTKGQNTVNEAPAKTVYSPDDVVFTEKAKSLSKAADIARNADGIDYDKVAALKKQYEEGTLEFDYERIAAKMMASEQAINDIFS